MATGPLAPLFRAPRERPTWTRGIGVTGLGLAFFVLGLRQDPIPSGGLLCALVVLVFGARDLYFCFRYIDRSPEQIAFTADRENDPGPAFAHGPVGSRRPGRELAHSLVAAESKLLGMLVGFIGAAVFGGFALLLLAGDMSTVGTAFAIGLRIVGAAVGLFAATLLFLAVNLVLRMTTVSPLRAEVSSDPIGVDEEAQLFFELPGRAIVRMARVQLVCTEIATYRSGTNTRTQTHECLRHTIHQDESLTLPWRLKLPFRCPPGAPMSFKGLHNELQWQVAVTVEIEGRVDVRESFLLRVGPVSSRAASPEVAR